MKIKGLSMTNFRNHSDTFMVINHLNFIAGENNAGKSSVKGALEYGLTGRNEWATNRNTKDLIRHGADKTSVEVEIENLGLVERSTGKQNEVRLNGGKLPDRELQNELIDEFNLTYDIINCVLNSSSFLDMSPNDQRSFLFRLTGVSLQPEKVVEFMDEPTDEALDIALKALKSIRGEITIEALDSIYKDFTAGRRNIKKERDALKARVTGAEEVPLTSGILINKVEEELLEENKKREDMLKQIAVINEKTRQKKQLSQYLKKIDEHKSTVAAKIEKGFILANAEEELFSIVSYLNKYDAEIGKHKEALGILGAQTNSLKNMLSKLSTTKCPLSEKLVCKTDKSFLTDEFKEQIARNEEQIQKREGRLKELADLKQRAETKKRAIEKQVSLANNYLQLMQQEKQIKEDFMDIEIEDKTDLEKKMITIKNKMKELEEEKKTHEDWKKQKIAYDTLIKRYQKAEKTVEIYEYLVGEFGPKGIKSRILEKVVAPIEKHCNENLDMLTKGIYSLQFSFEDGFDILVENEYGIVNANSLSSSEKLRVGIVLQDAINNLTQARVLFIDNAEILDKDNIKLLLELIKEIKDGYDNIFVVATDTGEKTMKLLEKSDYTLFYVEEGTVRTYR